jgi:hypothetical protein
LLFKHLFSIENLYKLWMDVLCTSYLKRSCNLALNLDHLAMIKATSTKTFKLYWPELVHGFDRHEKHVLSTDFKITFDKIVYCRPDSGII